MGPCVISAHPVHFMRVRQKTIMCDVFAKNIVSSVFTRNFDFACVCTKAKHFGFDLGFLVLVFCEF